MASVGFLDLRRRVARTRGVDNAVRQVILEQPHGNRLERTRGGRDLGQHLDAVRILVDHPLYASDLALNSAQPSQQGGLVAAVAGDAGQVLRCCRIHVDTIPP